MHFSLFFAALLPSLVLSSDPTTDAKVQKAVDGIIKQFKLELKKTADATARQVFESQSKNGKTREKRQESQMSYDEIRRDLGKQNNETLTRYYAQAYDIVYNGAYGLDKGYSNYRGDIQKRSNARRDSESKDVKLMKSKLNSAWEEVVNGKRIQKRAGALPPVAVAEAANLASAAARAGTAAASASQASAGRAAASASQASAGRAAAAAAEAAAGRAAARAATAAAKEMRGILFATKKAAGDAAFRMASKKASGASPEASKAFAIDIAKTAYKAAGKATDQALKKGLSHEAAKTAGAKAGAKAADNAMARYSFAFTRDGRKTITNLNSVKNVPKEPGQNVVKQGSEGAANSVKNTPKEPGQNVGNQGSLKPKEGTLSPAKVSAFRQNVAGFFQSKAVKIGSLVLGGAAIGALLVALFAPDPVFVNMQSTTDGDLTLDDYVPPQ